MGLSRLGGVLTQDVDDGNVLCKGLVPCVPRLRFRTPVLVNHFRPRPRIVGLHAIAGRIVVLWVGTAVRGRPSNRFALRVPNGQILHTNGWDDEKRWRTRRYFGVDRSSRYVLLFFALWRVWRR